MSSQQEESRGASREAPRGGALPAFQSGNDDSRRRLNLTDAALTAVYLLIVCGLGALSREQPYATPLWAIVLLAICGLVVLRGRRRSPYLAFAGAMVLTLLSFAIGTGAEGFLVMVALCSIGVTRSARVAWIYLAITMLFGALGAAILAFRIRFGPSLWGVTIPTDDRDSFLDWANCYAIIAAITLIVTLIGMNAGHRQRYIGALMNRAEQMERERDQQAEISVARERERIAREMHDVIAHSLSVMIAMADGASASTTQRPDEAKLAINRVSETGRRTLDEVRRLLGTVRGDEESSLSDHKPQPDASQLPALVADFAQAGLPVRLEMTGTPTDDPALGLTVYRIVQESLTNVLRHGRGIRSVSVKTSWSKQQVSILVEDSSAPTGVAPASRIGRGILGIRERAALYDGVVEAGPLGGGGWRVLVRLQREEQ